MKTLVCGGRDFNDAAGLYSTLDTIQRWTLQEAENTLGIAFGVIWETTGPITCIVHGAARGADLLAENWAKSREIAYHGHPAPWHTHDPRWCKCSGVLGDTCNGAGMWRNREMLRREHSRSFPVGICIALPGGKGTAGMVALCRAAGIEVYEPFRKAPTKGAQPPKMALDRPG